MSKARKSNYLIKALDKDIPIINSKGLGMGSRDISLGLSHNYAIDIAVEIILELDSTTRIRLLNDIWDIFYKWKSEKGIYPKKDYAYAGLFASLGADKKCEQMDAVKYEIKHDVFLEPWQCHSYAETPFALYEALRHEKYKPLLDFEEENNHNLKEHILAILVFASHDSNSEYQYSDCIYGGLKLSHLKLHKQSNKIEEMKPAFLEAQKRKTRKALSEQMKKQKTTQKVLSAYKECINEFGQDNFYYKQVAHKAGVKSLGTVSKILRENGIFRNKSN